MHAEAMQTAAGFVQQLAGDLNKGNLELPMFPDSVLRIQQVFQAQEVDLDEIIRIISSDPALAARVLQLSNSAAIRGAVEIADVRQAVVRIGNKLVQSSAVAFALRQAERNEGLSEESRIALKEIWAESWNMSEELVIALEEQLDTNPALQESATLTEVLSAARLILEHKTSGNALDASEYPLLQRLGIADHDDSSVTLDEHAEAIAEIRQGLSG